MLQSNQRITIPVPLWRVLLMVILTEPLKKRHVLIFVCASQVFQMNLVLRLVWCWSCEGFRMRVAPRYFQGGQLEDHFGLQGMHFLRKDVAAW